MVDTAIFSIFHRPQPLIQREHAEPDQVADSASTAPIPNITEEKAVKSQTVIEQEFTPEITEELQPQSLPVLFIEEGSEANVPTALESEDAFEGEIFLSGIEADHELLGLANPEVFSVNVTYAGQGGIDVTAERSGIYRPKGFRAAPWSGFAYDQAPDRLTGLAAGTRLLTARGEVAVEGLLPGDSVLALRGPALLPITWVGRSAAAEPPILIERGALGPDRPRRPLCLAPDQPVFVDPLPVPARQLVNGTTIRITETHEAELFHIDVGASEVLFAEGVPLSSGNRSGSAVPQ